MKFIKKIFKIIVPTTNVSKRMQSDISSEAVCGSTTPPNQILDLSKCFGLINVLKTEKFVPENCQLESSTHFDQCVTKVVAEVPLGNIDKVWKRRWEVRIGGGTLFVIYTTGLCSVNHCVSYDISKDDLNEMLRVCLRQLMK